MSLPSRGNAPSGESPEPGAPESGASGPGGPGIGGQVSPWSFRIATLTGIPVRVHFTFLLFLAWVAIVSQKGGQWPVLLVAVFFCVLLHEFGHALTARRYGIQTRDITLYPMGGVAMIQGRPTAKQELWISLAGPLVNIGIAIALIPVVSAVEGKPPSLEVISSGRSFWQGLLAVNVGLALFNLLPAFPMDGGRILRALLALVLTEAKATRIAAGIGQFMAILFGLWGLFAGEPILVLVAFMVFLGAAQEANATVTRSYLEGYLVADAMVTSFSTITSGATLDEAAAMLLAGSQQEFPVVVGDEVIGILTRTAITSGIAAGGDGAYVAGHMKRDPIVVAPDLALESAIEIMNEQRGLPLLVMDHGKLIGLVTRENLSEFVLLRHARSRSAA